MKGLKPMKVNTRYLSGLLQNVSSHLLAEGDDLFDDGDREGATELYAITNAAIQLRCILTIATGEERQRAVAEVRNLFKEVARLGFGPQTLTDIEGFEVVR